MDIENIRKGFQPNHTKIRDKNGKAVPSSTKAETIAKYLKEEQWGRNRKDGETKKT